MSQEVTIVTSEQVVEVTLNSDGDPVEVTVEDNLLVVKVAGTKVGTVNAINFIAGSGVTLSYTNNADGTTGNLTINSSAAAGALLSANNLNDVADAATARTNLGLGTLATQSGTFSGTSSGTNTGDQDISGKQNLVNAATALVDGATIDLTAIKHTLATASSRTFTISYTGDDITLEITLSATSATFTLPTGDKGIYGGTPSGTNTLVVTGATSGDVILVAIKKIGTVHYWIGKNAIR